MLRSRKEFPENVRKNKIIEIHFGVYPNVASINDIEYWNPVGPRSLSHLSHIALARPQEKV